MNQKETAEIKRRLNREKGNIPCVRGCYASSKGEVISVFRRSLASMAEHECDAYLALFRKVLSGAPGKNGIEVVFSADQMMNGEEHTLLMELRDTRADDDTCVSALYQKIIDSYRSETNYVILLMSDTYDVPRRAADGERSEDQENVFQYFICCVCPVRENKTGLSYSPSEMDFRDLGPDQTLAAPELGFLFPAFDDRSSNIYNALYYVKNPNEQHEDFVDAVFHTELPMAAPVQKATFLNVLEDSLREDLTFSTMQAVNDRMIETVETQKQEKKAEAPVITAPRMKSILADCGLPLEKLESFEDRFDAEFGRGTHLTAANIVNTRQVEVKTPNVVIHVNPEFSDLVETRVIDGKKYILIRAEEEVELNGVSVTLSDMTEE